MDDEAQLKQYQQQMQAAVYYAEQKKQGGEWSQEQVEEYLSYYYGEDWRETLRALNNQLSHKHPQKHLQTIMLLGSIVMVALIASLIAPLVSVSGNVVVELDEKVVLFAGDSHRVIENDPITNITIEASYTGPEDLELMIEDVNGVHDLGVVYRRGLECYGCENTYEPPFMLRAGEGEGSITIDEIAFVAMN